VPTKNGQAASIPVVVERRPPSAPSLPAHDLVVTKLRPPAPRAGLIPRAGLQSLLRAGLQGKLCLLDAPAGSGKTTLLVQWHAAAGTNRLAWVSLDEGDNDPTRFWVYVVEALRTVEPGIGATALEALQRTSADLDRVVLPSLLNELSAVAPPLVLVLDDYHLVTNAVCHQTLTFFLNHLPPGVHVVLATRADPPLPLARMRATGELVEIRVAQLQFTCEEAAELLNGSMGLGLSTDDLQRLTERTEGWAAGLYLSGLSLRGRPDPGGFIAAFHGDHRHVADFLAAEVLAGQPRAIRQFLLWTSILERLSGPLCDAVLTTEGSAGLLRELERSNLFLVPLDDHRQWYRYHQLFAQLLRVELASHDSAVIPALHSRAAAWHRHVGHIDEAIHHFTASGEFAEAGALIARQWLECWRRGRRATVARWLDGLPDEAILANPPVAFVAAWIGGFSGVSRRDTERWLAAMEAADWEGPLPAGISSLAFGANLARAALVFDDVGRSIQAARRALALAGPEPSPFLWMAVAALGRALYLSGQPADTRPLEELVRRVPATELPFALVTALAVLSLIAGDKDDDRAALALASRAAVIAEAQGLGTEPLCGIVHMALGGALAQHGRLAEAEERLGRALDLFGIESMIVERAHTLLLLAAVRHRRGDLPGAQAPVQQARELIEQSTDPGMLPALLERNRQALGPAPRRRVEVTAPLTEREIAVLRLLSTRLSNREISRELYVSVNTVRTHVQGIYRKLGVATRSEAVTRARQLALLTGRTPTAGSISPG
jgi:LuxR family maltose regulon positive regulatory protein